MGAHIAVEKAWTVLLAIAFLCSSATAEITLKSMQGQEITVEVLSVGPKEAMVVMQSRRMKVPMSQLTDESKAQLIEYAKAKGVFEPFPAVKVEVQVARKRRNTAGSFYKKDLTISPTVVISGVSRLEPIPTAEATMLVVCMDTAAKYGRGKEKFVVQLHENKPIPAVENGNPRTFNFEDLSLTYDGDRDSSNVGGLVFKYYVFALRDPATKQIINFQTNDPQLTLTINRHPEKRDQILAIPTGAPYPATFE